MARKNHTVVRDANGFILGTISQGGCQNPKCKEARKAGRLYHAIPSGPTPAWETYHFVTLGEAATAIEKSMVGFTPTYLTLEDREEELARFINGEKAQMFQEAK